MSELGEVVPLGIIVRDTAGAPVNATDVSLTLTLPDGTLLADGTSPLPPVLNPPPVAGHYAVDYVPRLQAGMYVFRWETTAPDLVYEGTFHVDPPYSVGLISLTQAKTLLNIDVDDTAHDRDIMDDVAAATELAEQERGEVLLRRTVVEDRDLGRAWTNAVALTQRPAQVITSVARLDAYGTPVTVLGPPDVWVDSRGILRSARGLHGHLRITYVAGYRVVPPAFRTAVGYILQAVWDNRGGSARRPRVGGQQPGEGDGNDATSVPQRALDLLGTRRQSPLVG